jgi:protein-S-isoprenylcysteine O-methyltransferase Ste14
MLPLRALFWTLVVPGAVTVYVPYLILSQASPATIDSWGASQLLALLLIVVGTGVLLHCIGTFAVSGRGTLSPLDAPQSLVIRGLYRSVRNPMYLGVLAILLGEAWLFESLALLEYALGWFALIHLVVILHEEPVLRRRFGESYQRYCRSVRRWLPGRPFEQPAGDKGNSDESGDRRGQP